MAYYEFQNSGAAFSKRRIAYSKSINFPMHLHTSFEFLYVKEGEVLLGVEGARYRLRSGDHALIPPNVAHEYITENYSIVGIVIFNPDYLSELYEESASGVLREPIFRSEPSLFLELEAVEKEHLLFRSVLYRVAAEYVKNEIITPCPERSGSFALAVSNYLDEHYAEPLDEAQVARAMGYHQRYLSVLINRNFGVSFTRLLSEYRVREACRQLRVGEKSITEIYLAAGFNSQSTFNRNFKAIMGVTPQKYKQGIRISIEDHGG